MQKIVGGITEVSQSATYEFANRSRVTHSRFSIIAKTHIASTLLRGRQNPTSVNSAAYNRRRTYVYFRIGWDNWGFTPDGKRGGRIRPRSDRSKDSWGQDGRSIGGNGHRSGKNEMEITWFAIDRFRKRPLTKLCTLVVLPSINRAAVSLQKRVVLQCVKSNQF